MADGEDGAAFERRLRATLGDLASVSDQSDGRTIIRVGGARAREASWRKACRSICIRGAFRPGDAGDTTVATSACTLWQVDDTPTYELIVPRSFAASFWEWLTESAAEFGYVIADGSG